MAAQSTDSKAAKGQLTSKVRGTFRRGGVVHGTFDPSRFITRGGQDYAVGTLHAVMRKANGQLVGKANPRVTIPVRNGFASKAAKRNCQVLDLVLGPLDLNLLGLKVHLNRVILHIVAASGAGALLGNLICAVAHLLDGTRLIDLLKLANVLNRILDALRL
ncbi:MAG: hypothetical protein ABJA81_08285 [Nocardioidaceae bacterium]